MKTAGSVMCVIIGVRKTKDVVEITRTDGQKGNMSSDEEMFSDDEHISDKEGRAKIEANISGKTMTWSRLPQNTTLAYKVLELTINLKSGAIEPSWNSIVEAGFIDQLDSAPHSQLQMEKTIFPQMEKLKSSSSSQMFQCAQDWIPIVSPINSITTPIEVTTERQMAERFASSISPEMAYNPIQLQGVGLRFDRKISAIDTADSIKADVETPKEEVLDSCRKPNQQELFRQNLPQDKLNTIQQCVKTRQDLSPQFRHMQDQLEPLLPRLLEENIRSSLLQLMRCHNDLALFSNMLDNAKRGPLREERKIYQHSASTDALFKIFELAGFKIENEDIVYEEKKPTKIFRAVAYIVAAMCDVDEKYLVKISQCSAEQFKALEKIFRTVISSEMTAVVTIDNEIQPALKKPAKDILTDMDFGLRFYSWTILPPKTHTEVHECLYCIIYCFS